MAYRWSQSIRSCVPLLVIAILGPGCEEQPPGGEGAAVEERVPADEDDFPRGGPLQGRWEYVLCLRDEANPMNAGVVLREEDKEERRLVHFFVADRTVRRKDLDLEFLVVAADPEKLVYWKEDPRRNHELRRVRDGTEVKVPAPFLAAFVGESMGLPILHDARAGFAEREIAVRADEDNLDSARARDLLAASGMPLLESGLASGDRVLYWKSPGTSTRQPPGQDSAPPVPIVETPSRGAFAGGRIDVEHGRVPLMDLLRLLSDVTGLAVHSNLDPDSLGKRDLLVVSRLNGVDDALVKALLEVNGLFAVETALADGSRAIVLRETAER
jgi:hypothetical protein